MIFTVDGRFLMNKPATAGSRERSTSRFFELAGGGNGSRRRGECDRRLQLAPGKIARVWRNGAGGALIANQGAVER